MAHFKPYPHLSEVFPNDHDLSARAVQRALGFVEESLHAIDSMENEQREAFLKVLTTWLITEKFGPHARALIQGLQRYAIADCLFENPNWEPPPGGIFVDARN